MDKQFTASEVRQQARELFAHNAAHQRAMLAAFADLLEAQEKAVPVGYVSADALKELESGEALNIRLWASSDDFVGSIVEIYTRPSPSDAERLAEALHSIGERLSSVLCDPFGEVVVRGSDGDRRVLTQALKDLGELTAHSAQAQPPVQSEYAPTYPDQAKDPFWTVPGMVDTRPKTHGTQAQPPAASVAEYLESLSTSERGIAEKAAAKENPQWVTRLS